MSVQVLTVRRLRVREAKHDDIESVLPLVREHWPDLPWGHLPLDEQRIRTIFMWLLTTVGCCAWVIDDGEGRAVGFLGLSLMPHIYTGELQAANPWWYVEKSARGTRASFDLLRIGEKWAAAAGAAMTISVHDEKVGAMLERMGYHKVEISYRKGL